MNKIRFLITLIVLKILVPNSLQAQTISGIIESSYGEKIPLASVIVKDSMTAGIKEFTIAYNGQYTISLKREYKKIIIEVSANKYRKEFLKVDTLSKNRSYTYNFILQKEQSAPLKEVIVTAKARPFQIKGDTVKYNVGAYKDGSERKIEDIIKKLPGIEVNETTGEITYKGKSIETVKLEGDDLFGSNYTIGTRNINVNMVDEIQAVENYSSNPLLKGIESGDKVALNLKLKKGKMDFSGDLSVGNGVFETGKIVNDDGANILGISKNFKSFGTLSYNNIGVNNSPFDYFSYNPSIEEIKETDFIAKKIIPETYFPNSFDDKRANANNAWFGNYNAVVKANKRLSVKTNLYYINDRITSNQHFETNNFIDSQTLLTSDKYNIQKKPEQYRGDLELKYNTSKNSLLEYKLILSNESINTFTNVLQNKISNYETELKTKNSTIRQSLLFTQRISNKKAFQVQWNYSDNKIPENFYLVPAVYRPQFYDANNQYSNFGKTITSLQSVFLGSTSKTKYRFSIGGNAEKNPFQSSLAVTNNAATSAIDSFANSITQKKYSLYNLGVYNIILGRWKISPSYSLSYLQQALVNNITNKKTDRDNVIFEPAFALKYKLNEVSGLLGNISYKQKPFSEEYLFNNPVYISNRATINNEPSLQLQKTLSCGFFYLMNNLFKQFQLNIGASYNKSGGGYFSNIFIQENSTQIQYFYLHQSNESINVNFLVEKYMAPLASTIRLKSNYSIFNYKNIVNNSDLRNNNNQFFGSELFMKTAFDLKINFENITHYNKISSRSDKTVSFANESINNTFKVIVKPDSRYFILLSSDYFLPNLKNSREHYLFLDASLRFTPKSKKFEINFTAKNILNNATFTQVETNDYSTTFFQTNLIPRYVMLSVSHNF